MSTDPSNLEKGPESAFAKSSQPSSILDVPARQPTRDAMGEELAMHKTKSNSHMSVFQENLFMITITCAQLVQMIPLGAGINSGLSIGEQFGASHGQSVWIAASYPLTQGSFVLIGGRLGSVYGHRNAFALGCLWWTFWALAGGFSNNLVAMCIMRGLCGIGGGLMIPNIVALLGITFPPGMKRNISFALFGSMAPVGAAGGNLLSGIIVQLTEWKWLFLLLGLLGLVVFTTAVMLSPNDLPQDPTGQIDWIGAYLGVGALILFNFVWNQAPIVGWDSPYIIVLLIISIIHFGGFAYWEMKMAKQPILPFNIWKAPSFGPLMVVIFFSFMALGIFIYYMNVFMITIRGDTLIEVGVQYLPLTIVGVLGAFLAGIMATKMPAQYVIGIGLLCVIACSSLLATIKADITYWAMAFPAMFLSGFTLDLIVTSAQIIASSSVSIKHQGVAGSLCGTLLSYGMSTGLGFAATIEVHTFRNGTDLLRGYHSAAYLAVALGAAALIITALFVRIPQDTQEGWNKEAESAPTPTTKA